jgi:hypothetical protein
VNIKRRTLDATAEHLHDPISAFFPPVPPSFDHATHPRCTRADNVILVYTTTTGTPTVLCVNMPGPRGMMMPSSALGIAGRGSVDGS